METDVSSLVNSIRAHLEAKNDTERFVALNLLIKLFETHPDIRKDKQQVGNIWQSIPPKFLDRLLKTACNPKAKDAQECLTLAVSVMHAFSLLLSEAGKDEKFTGRISKLVPALVYSSPETTDLELQLLLSLAREPQGAKEILGVNDLSPLTEAAPSNHLALDVLRYAWLSSMHSGAFTQENAERMNKIIQGLVASFSDTDGTTLLNFMGDFLREADSIFLPCTPPTWVSKVISYIHSLCSKRPAPEARDAYTNAADSLLKTWPAEAATQLFSSKKQDVKATEHLFITLVLVDIRASIPILVEQRVGLSYDRNARRVARAYDIVSQFIGFLVKISDGEDEVLKVMSFDHLMSLRKSISETIECSIEFLLERRTQDEVSNTEGRWRLSEDELALAALRAISLWVQENDDDKVRNEIQGLTDLLHKLYTASMEDKAGATPELDFRGPCLIILQAITEDSDGAGYFGKSQGFSTLLDDCIFIGQAFLSEKPYDNSRWRDLIPVLDQMVFTVESHFDVYQSRLEAVAFRFSKSARSGKTPISADDEIREFEFAVCRLVCDILRRASDLQTEALGSLNKHTRMISDNSGVSWDTSVEDLYHQVVAVDEDTPKDSPLKMDVEALVIDLARLKDKATS